MFHLNEKIENDEVYVIAVNDIEIGEAFTEENIRVIRPSNGLSPKYYHEILGEYSTRKIKRGEPIHVEDIRDKKIDEASDRYELRDAEADDINLLFTWANDPVTRKNAFHTEQIPFEDHKRWFTKLLNDSTQRQYIFMKNGQPVGQIRFSISEDEAEIDYSIAPDKRGYGYGKCMIELAKKRFHADCPEVKKLIGQVKIENYASSNCFKKSGFDETFQQFEYNYKE